MTIRLNKRKFTKNMICSLSLVVALLITGIFAFMAATDKKSNIVTLGDINIDLIENGWEQITEIDSDNFGYYVRTDGGSVNTIPGQTIQKAPYIVNIGDSDAWTYLIVKVPTLSEEEFANSRTYIENYGAKYNIELTAVGIQDGLIKSKNNEEISDINKLWTSCYGDKNSFFNEEPAKSTRIDPIKFNELDNTNWEKVSEYKGINHNFYVYGFKTILHPADNTTSLYASFVLDTLFGTGYNSSSILPLGGCLYYINTEEGAGCDKDGHPYKYTFYDENGNELSEEEVFVSNHKIKKYKVEIPEFYKTELKAGRITQAEYNAVPATPIIDKYFVVAATEVSSNKWELLNINTDTSKQLVWSTDTEEGSATSPATYPLNVYVKDFLTENDIAYKYYTVSGDTWTLKANAAQGNYMFGAGKLNTKFIYDFYGTSDTTMFSDNTIWGMLDTFNNNKTINKTGCSDWYIPSIRELAQIKDTPSSTIAFFSSDLSAKGCFSSSEYNIKNSYKLNASGDETYTGNNKFVGENNLYITRSF